jgi:hypothetical protein
MHSHFQILFRGVLGVVKQSGRGSSIDAHGLKIQGGGVRDVFAKIPRGGQGFQEKLPPSLRFIAFLLTSFSKIFLGGCCFIPPPPPP